MSLYASWIQFSATLRFLNLVILTFHMRHLNHIDLLCENQTSISNNSMLLRQLNNQKNKNNVPLFKSIIFLGKGSSSAIVVSSYY